MGASPLVSQATPTSNPTADPAIDTLIREVTVGKVQASTAENFGLAKELKAFEEKLKRLAKDLSDTRKSKLASAEAEDFDAAASFRSQEASIDEELQKVAALANTCLKNLTSDTAPPTPTTQANAPSEASPAPTPKAPGTEEAPSGAAATAPVLPNADTKAPQGRKKAITALKRRITQAGGKYDDLICDGKSKSEIVLDLQRRLDETAKEGLPAFDKSIADIPEEHDDDIAEDDDTASESSEDGSEARLSITAAAERGVASD